MRECVHVAEPVFGERGQQRHRELGETHGDAPVRLDRRKPDPAVAVVAEDVGAREVGDRLTAVHASADARARLGGARVGEGRRSVLVGRGAPGAQIPLDGGPTEVEPEVDVCSRDPRDLLDGVLADVGDPEVPGGRVEGEAPGVPQPPEEDLVEGVRVAAERVLGGDAGGGVAPWIDAQDRPQPGAEVLGVVVGVLPEATVAEPDEESSLRVDDQVAAVVVPVGLLQRQEGPLPVRVGLEAVEGDGDHVACHLLVGVAGLELVTGG